MAAKVKGQISRSWTGAKHGILAKFLTFSLFNSISLNGSLTNKLFRTQIIQYNHVVSLKPLKGQRPN